MTPRRTHRAPDSKKESAIAPRAGVDAAPSRRPGAADRESTDVSAVEADIDGVDWESWLAELGGALRVLRASTRLSQRDLARVCGVSQGAVSRFEAGRRRGVPAHVILKIAAALARQPRADDQAVGRVLRRILGALVQLVREARLVSSS